MVATIPLIIGIVMIIIAVVSLAKLVREMLIALVVVGVLVLGIFLVINSIPSLAEEIGLNKLKSLKNLEKPDINLPSSISNLIPVVGKSESVNILATGKDKQGDLMIVVANNGKNELKDFIVKINNNSISWSNEPEIPLKSGAATIFETTYRPVEDKYTVFVKANNVTDTYP